MKRKVLLTSSTCGPCHMLKNRLEKEKLTVETKTYNDPDDREFFIEHKIKSVPRLVIIDEDDKIEIVQGMDEIVEAIKND